MPKIFGISYLRVIKRSEMKNIRLTFATVTVLSFCSGFINPIWAGKSDEKNFEISRNLDIFNSLFKELNMFYVDTINAEKAIGDGVNAMLARLDPYTEYIPEKEKDDFFFSTTGEYAGIGSFIMERDNAVYISEPYEGMPAQLAGLRPGDKIVMIDNCVGVEECEGERAVERTCEYAVESYGRTSRCERLALFRVNS